MAPRLGSLLKSSLLRQDRERCVAEDFRFRLVATLMCRLHGCRPRGWRHLIHCWLGRLWRRGGGGCGLWRGLQCYGRRSGARRVRHRADSRRRGRRASRLGRLLDGGDDVLAASHRSERERPRGRRRGVEVAAQVGRSRRRLVARRHRTYGSDGQSGKPRRSSSRHQFLQGSCRPANAGPVSSLHPIYTAMGSLSHGGCDLAQLAAGLVRTQIDA